nr:uncharacterized protein LOC133575142 isoform X1 [Nerophis lumbriciformis]XP_061783650.1 uncharacterized protein LOC133575142 isoform X1 [Nerophis lumbriciformis]
MLEQMNTDGVRGKVEPCRWHSDQDPGEKSRKTDYMIEKLEMQSMVMKEQNKELTAEVQILQEQKEKDQIRLNRFSLALQNLEYGIEAAQIGLQQRDEVIQQNKLQLKQAEETVEEYANIIKDLRLTNQELKSQLEDREDEASLDTLNDLLGDKEASHVPAMSLAEEIRLLASTAGMKSMLVPSKDSSHEDSEPEEASSLLVKPPTSKCTQAKTSSSHKVVVLCMLLLVAILLSLAAGSHADFVSISELWRRLCLTLEPYFNVHYGALPPV